MELDWILRITLLGIVHWILAGLLLHDLTYRRKVVGGRKWLWALLIIFIMCFGSVIYLFFHPQILYQEEDEQEHYNKSKK